MHRRSILALSVVVLFGLTMRSLGEKAGATDSLRPGSNGLPPAFFAQRDQDALSQAEIEQLRDTNRMPNERVLAFVKFLDERSETIRNLVTKPRRPGREQDIHDAMEQFVSIADNLEDNLNEYSTRHRDVRKALPKLLRAIDRWSSIIKSPPDDDAYNVSRKLTLESIRDLREDTEHLIEEQRVWFAAHPPQKDAEGNVVEQ